MTAAYSIFVQTMASAVADAFDAEHLIGPGLDELSDHDYRLAIEFDLLGRPRPPYTDRECEFTGTLLGPPPSSWAPWWGSSTNDLPLWHVHAVAD